MTKIVTIIGARPQFIKASAVSRLIKNLAEEVIVHTGQHYDDNLSDVFFNELEIPPPKYHLGIGSGTHGVQTGEMLQEIEKVLITESPDWVLVYGDTNSTLAGALAAAKLNQKVAHVEAGLRSFNRHMPEEINRILTDHLSECLFCPSETAVNNLAAEGITAGVVNVGDVMMESQAFAIDRAEKQSNVLDELDLQNRSYYLVTIHRAENTLDAKRLGNIISAIADLDKPVIFPVHPRTEKAIRDFELEDILGKDHIRVIKPLGYLDMAKLLSSARMLLTDSGGLQKEAYWLKVPCVTLRDETEWVETVETGWNVLAGADHERIIVCIQDFVEPELFPALYGDGEAARKIISNLV